jgi:predicted hotdog family 3-hydroxylacyl-ACP dehydratase
MGSLDGGDKEDGSGIGLELSTRTVAVFAGLMKKREDCVASLD